MVMIVKDIMVPLAEYATVSQDASLAEAVKALRKAQKEFRQDSYKHRAILAKNENDRIVGKLSQLDVIKALEPKYFKLGNQQSLSKFGFSKQYIQTIFNEHQLWDKSLDDLCKKASQLIVKDFMYAPTEGEIIEENASLNSAIHQFVMGKHQSLLVTGGGRIVGVLRLVDIFREIANRIIDCQESKL